MSGSAVAETDSLQSGIYHAILGDGTLRYREFDEPDRPNCVTAAPTCSRKTGGTGRLDCQMIVSKSSNTISSSTTQSVTGSSKLQSVSAYSGESNYETEATLHGLHHEFHADDCRRDTLGKEFQDGVFYSELLAFLASIFETPAAVAIPGAAVILLKTNRSRIKETNQGRGIAVEKYLTEIDQPLLLGDGSGAYSR